MMKKALIGIGVLVFILTGCSDKFSPERKSVVSMMQNNEGTTKIVGWENYKDDSDCDGVPDYKDKCPNTPLGAKVDKEGCALDTDKDGVPNGLDKCPNTPLGAKVDKEGCALDTDKDGVPNGLDKCPNTPLGVKVNDNGCALDTDKDGVPNYKDECPNTPLGVKVNKHGCALDTDKDGVPDYKDKCPNTPLGVAVNHQGCPILAQFRFNFKFNSWKIDKKYYPQIQKLAKLLKKNKGIKKIEIQGYTDNIGSYLYNKTLSIKRANALRIILINKYGIKPSRIDIVGFGSDYPVANNNRPEGRAANRRVTVIDSTCFTNKCK